MTTRQDSITSARKEKIEKLRNRGVNPYPHRYQRTHTTVEAVALLEKIEADSADTQEISVAGRITAKRGMGKMAFLDIRDGFGRIQLLFQGIKQYDEEKAELFKDLDIGDILGVTGTIVRTRTGEPTIQVSSFTLLAKSLQTLPEKWHGLSDTEKRYRQRYLDLIANTEVKDLFMKRSLIIAGIRSFMNDLGFIEVETPILQPIAGGASARPFITHHNTLDQDLYLRIALELYLKRLIVGGFDKVYEIGRNFRNEGISTRHNPEFTMMESYEAYADYNKVMEMVEQMVSQVALKVLGTIEVQYEGVTIDIAPPWKRLDLRQAVKEYSGIDFEEFPEQEALRAEMERRNIEADPQRSWGKLVDDLISEYVEPNLMQPTFLVDYPIAMSPLAKSKPDNPRFVERFEAFIGKMEIGNAFTELNDPQEQERRFIIQKEEHEDENEDSTIDYDYIMALEHGMPPTGGLGVGLDRLVMLLTGQSSIREVILFPQLRNRE